MTQEQKNYLLNLRDEYLTALNSISSDFVDDHAEEVNSTIKGE